MTCDESHRPRRRRSSMVTVAPVGRGQPVTRTARSGSGTHLRPGALNEVFVRFLWLPVINRASVPVTGRAHNPHCGCHMAAAQIEHGGGLWDAAPGKFVERDGPRVPAFARTAVDEHPLEVVLGDGFGAPQTLAQAASPPLWTSADARRGAFDAAAATACASSIPWLRPRTR
jgi:hypothetical protein